MNGGDPLPTAIATAYYTSGITGDQFTDLIGALSATRLRLLKADLEDEPLDLAAPDGVDVYDGDATAVEPAADDEL